MSAANRPYVLARLTAWTTWLLVGVPEVIAFVGHGAGASGAADWRWMAAYLAFGPTLYAPASVTSRAWLQGVRLSVATLAADAADVPAGMRRNHDFRQGWATAGRV